MDKIEQLLKYNFHDSLLESIDYDRLKRKAVLKIDFCNWKQEWYNETDAETSMIFLVFENVYNISIPEFELNSDEIIEFELIPERGVKIIVFNDISNSTYEITVLANDIEIIEDLH